MKTYLLLVIFFSFITGCNSSRIINSWRTAELTPKNYKNILVLGMIRDQDSSLRLRMENHLTGDLKNLGYSAVSTLQIYGARAFDNMDESAAVSMLRTTGVDAILTIVLRNKEKETRYLTPHPLHTQPDNRFWDYHTHLNQQIYQAGYYATNTKYYWETNFYTLSDQRLLYTARTRSFEPASSEKMSHEYGLLIIRDMIKKKLFTPPAKDEN